MIESEIIHYFLKRGHLVSPQFFENLPQDLDKDSFYSSFSSSKPFPFVINNIPLPSSAQPDTRLSSLSKKGRTSFSIHNSPILPSGKQTVSDFVSHFTSRYRQLQEILRLRPEFQNVISIGRVSQKQKDELLSIIGIVFDKEKTKNGNILLTLEDPTGQVKVLIHKNNYFYSSALDLVYDEVIGITGKVGDRIIFANSLFLPDTPYTKEIKKSPDEAYAAFISDIHIGSVDFLSDDFFRFIDWINCCEGTEEQRTIASKVRYLFIVGDLIDGVGIFPGQDLRLAIQDIRSQYAKAAELLSYIRKDIIIFVCPGQHDAIRISEPQPTLDLNYAAALACLPNVRMLTNPSFVTIHSSEDFPGFDILLYHGASFHYYINSVESLIANKARDNPRFVHRFLLQRRHLAPAHSSNLYIPTPQKDPLVIEKVPDVFVCGDLHRSDISTYNNIITINCSCFQAKTDFQEKTGNNPDPSRVPVLNLQTREVKVLRFDSHE